MKKMQEVDLLKNILLDEKSIFLFNFLAGKINLFDVNQCSYNFFDKNIQELVKTSHHDMKKTKFNDDISRKILNLFDNYIENF